MILPAMTRTETIPDPATPAAGAPSPDLASAVALTGHALSDDAGQPAAPPVCDKSRRQWDEAMRRLELVRAYRVQCGAGPDESLESTIAAGRRINRSAAAMRLRDAGIAESRTSLDRFEREHAERGFAGLFDSRENAGRPPKFRLEPSEVEALRAARLVTNRTCEDGSTPEAVRIAIRNGRLRPEIAAGLGERDRAGLPVPRTIHRAIVAPPAVTRCRRSPADAALQYLDAPGSLMWITDETTGEERFARVGDVLEADDATINFPVCVPWEMGGDPCSERWGVRVARFQWLVAIDRASRYVPGYSYTARPRSGYRAEDITSLFHRIFTQHGVWSRLCLERGTWEAAQVAAMLRLLKVRRITAWSPHQKPFIEGLFNLLWTKLSDMPGQVGRFRGDEDAMDSTLLSCKRGATDPRNHFPMLSDAIAAFDRACFERNEQPVKSAHWGSWVPQERWLSQLEDSRRTGRLRPLPADAAWLFTPEVREWTVAGNTVGGSIRIMDGLSVRYDFAAPWLVEFAGCKVRVHFDPAAPRCEATIVLAHSCRDRRTDEVLGTAVQVNKTAGYARRVLAWGDDPDLGVQQRRQAAAALRREVRTLLPHRGIGTRISEVRDGLGNAVSLEHGNHSQPPAPEHDLARARARRARLAEARALLETSNR
jgi:hypothetical protein